MSAPTSVLSSHAQALVGRVTGVIVRLALEVPPLSADILTDAVDQLQTVSTSLCRLQHDLEPEVRWPSPLRPGNGDHPDFTAWLAGPDMVTGEPDRRQLTVYEIFDCWQYLEPKPVAVLVGGQMSEVERPRRADVLLGQLAESILLLLAEAPTWSPHTRAAALRLLHVDLPSWVATECENRSPP